MKVDNARLICGLTFVIYGICRYAKVVVWSQLKELRCGKLIYNAFMSSLFPVSTKTSATTLVFEVVVAPFLEEDVSYLVGTSKLIQHRRTTRS